MLTKEEIRKFIDEDDASPLKRKAREGVAYYEGRHDILDYRMFYWNADGNLVEDTTRSNVRIPHQFYTELVDQGTQHILSGEDGIFQSDDPELQKWLDLYFNKNRTFKAELSETITGQQKKGFDYMYAFKGKDDRLVFENADCLGVVEVEGRFAEDGKDQRIYRYVDRIDKDGNTQWKILVIDDGFTYYYCQSNEGEIKEDTSQFGNHHIEDQRDLRRHKGKLIAVDRTFHRIHLPVDPRMERRTDRFQKTADLINPAVLLQKGINDV